MDQTNGLPVEDVEKVTHAPNWWKRGVAAVLLIQIASLQWQWAHLTGAEPMNDPKRCGWVGAPPVGFRFCTDANEAKIARGFLGNLTHTEP